MRARQPLRPRQDLPQAICTAYSLMDQVKDAHGVRRGRVADHDVSHGRAQGAAPQVVVRLRASANLLECGDERAGAVRLCRSSVCLQLRRAARAQAEGVRHGLRCHTGDAESSSHALDRVRGSLVPRVSATASPLRCSRGILLLRRPKRRLSRMEDAPEAGRSDGHVHAAPHVLVLEVTHLMGEYCLELLFAEHIHEALSHSHCGVASQACGKRVWFSRGDAVNSPRGGHAHCSSCLAGESHEARSHELTAHAPRNAPPGGPKELHGERRGGDGDACHEEAQGGGCGYRGREQGGRNDGGAREGSVRDRDQRAQEQVARREA
mmetsp:Transcript_16822/g.51823  ORF Transcript_16822/g.51823 Transcript_16822/m.51823 type:complete len:322 (-) Transcript_16822:260-1225(-)